jgi:hypothetical protein
MRIFLLTFFTCVLPIILSGQTTGGRTVYTFLNLPASARLTALGGRVISVADDDINLAVSNPALLNPRMHGQLGFSHSFFPGNIQHGYFAYGHHFTKLGGTFQLGVQYVDYGELAATNIFFQEEGVFEVKESALALGAAFPIDERIQIGANLKWITSTLANLQSLGIAGDLGLLYQDTARSFSFGLNVVHLGTQLTTYSGLDNLREPLPFEIQIGLSKKLRYLPFRFSAVYRNLNRWNIRYDDPNQENGTIFNGEEANTPGLFSRQLDNFFRHLLFSGELLLGARENFRLRAAYDHRLRKELSVQGFGSASGFSFGVGIKINRFRLDYGRGNIHLAGGINHLGISTNLKEFKSRQ